MRVVAGTARGRALAAPSGLGTRPTSDKVRGAIFNVLGQFFEGGEVLDLYAGSGALAIEALSRGCTHALCIERDRAATEVIRKNAERCGFGDCIEVRREAVESALPRLPRAAFSLVLVDPPYADGPELALDLLSPIVVTAGRVVAEHDAHSPPPDRVGELLLDDRRNYGGTGISIYRLG